MKIPFPSHSMFSRRLIEHLSLNISASCQFQTLRCFGGSTYSSLPLKAGTVLTFLDFVKEKEAPVVLPREEYPSWVSELVKPQVSLAALRRIPNEEADDPEIRRYLKLTRRQRIREKNEQASV